MHCGVWRQIAAALGGKEEAGVGALELVEQDMGGDEEVGYVEVVGQDGRVKEAIEVEGDVEAVGYGEGDLEVIEMGNDIVEVEELVVGEVEPEGGKDVENFQPYWLVEGRHGEVASLSCAVLVDTFLVEIVEVLVDTVELEGMDTVLVDFEIKLVDF